MIPIFGSSHDRHQDHKKTTRSTKFCYLDSCTYKPGCLHCTCDGKCYLGHENRKCGRFREGNGPGCLVLECRKNETCKHSRRAICYTCRKYRTRKAQGSSYSTPFNRVSKVACNPTSIPNGNDRSYSEAYSKTSIDFILCRENDLQQSKEDHYQSENNRFIPSQQWESLGTHPKTESSTTFANNHMVISISKSFIYTQQPTSKSIPTSN